jgi:hypothetical protein
MIPMTRRDPFGALVLVAGHSSKGCTGGVAGGDEAGGGSEPLALAMAVESRLAPCLP